jgi:hypothetical protein
VEFTLTCELANGEQVRQDLTYHLLQDERQVRRHTRARVRRASTAKAPVFKQPLYAVSVREEGTKNHLVTAVPAVSPDGERLRYSMVSLLDSRYWRKCQRRFFFFKLQEDPTSVNVFTCWSVCMLDRARI